MTHPNAISVAYYPRRLSDLERDIVVGTATREPWNRLANVEPAPGQVCRYILIHPDWPSDGKIETGFWTKNMTVSVGEVIGADSYPLVASATGFERGDGGIFVGDPQHTYWQGVA